MRIHAIPGIRASRHASEATWCSLPPSYTSSTWQRPLQRVAERPTMQEWLEHTGKAKPIQAKTSAARVIRELRDER